VDKEEDRELKEKAEVALSYVSSLVKYFGKTPLRVSQRIRVSASLLAASMDHGHAAMLLLKSVGSGLGISAAGLGRLQLEALVKAIYFGAPGETSEAEIERFAKDGVMPLRVDFKAPKRGGNRRRGNKLPKRAVTLAQMEVVALRELQRVSAAKQPLTALSTFPVDDMHSIVHGGKLVVDLYHTGTERIGFNASRDTLIAIARNAAMLSMWAVLYALIEYRQGELLPLDDAWHIAAERFKEAFKVTIPVT
jgi:hypothetical protein